MSYDSHRPMLTELQLTTGEQQCYRRPRSWEGGCYIPNV